MKSNFNPKVKVKYVNLKSSLDLLKQEGYIDSYININNIVFCIVVFPKARCIEKFTLNELELL